MLWPLSALFRHVPSSTGLQHIRAHSLIVGACVESYAHLGPCTGLLYSLTPPQLIVARLCVFAVLSSGKLQTIFFVLTTLRHIRSCLMASCRSQTYAAGARLPESILNTSACADHCMCIPSQSSHFNASWLVALACLAIASVCLRVGHRPVPRTPTAARQHAVEHSANMLLPWPACCVLPLGRAHTFSRSPRPSIAAGPAR